MNKTKEDFLLEIGAFANRIIKSQKDVVAFKDRDPSFSLMS